MCRAEIMLGRETLNIVVFMRIKNEATAQTGLVIR